MKVKTTLCELLSEVHAELGASQFGRHVNAKLRVTDYVKNKQVSRVSLEFYYFFVALGNESKGRDGRQARLPTEGK